VERQEDWNWHEETYGRGWLGRDEAENISFIMIALPGFCES